MFDKILIATRGEDALRIMRSARELGVRTVAVYSTEDADTYPVAYADESVCIGPPPAAQSYLVASNIIAAAKTTGSKAIHPGCGPLAGNAEFASTCIENGIAFIGPSPDNVRAMSDRATAQSVMKSCGVPLIPGSARPVGSLDEAGDIARSVGYPVLVKVFRGDGTKTTVKATTPSELRDRWRALQELSENGTESGDIHIEKYLEHARLVSVQVLGDAHGNRVTLCERDCAVRRRKRKLVEEAPSPALSDDMRRAMSVAALKAVRALDYRSTGAVELLLTPDGKFYFLGMKTFLQAEHPAIEAITGVDIVKEQIRIAANEPMSCAERSPFSPFGHAIQLNITAEDPDDDFKACPGVISKLQLPMGPGVRVDTYMADGSRISPHYSSRVAKLVISGQDRDEALARARRALDEFTVEGVKTTIPFYRRVLDNTVFCAGEATTDFMETQMGDLQ